jgi:hypothetical protein
MRPGRETKSKTAKTLLGDVRGAFFAGLVYVIVVIG